MATRSWQESHLRRERRFLCGVHFVRKRASSLLFGVGEDAEIVAASAASGVPS
ncbi:hypothetical protein ISU10_09145 [Nocardioides agariphilus]|uniref:Uncharacterized protein n=1 Tax=Nocardioides agariphilus TaxID=433664 RepID=A0A930VND4_9ACTN|nr:hypothetical protein [Nocardioides agariphilus]MBF4767930.1 hypothetical protein [Nocardioides agariphilus]